MRRLVRDQRGTTLAELMVGLATGTVVMFGLTTLVVVTLHTTTRTSARVDATSRARVTLDRLLDQLHSGCVMPKIAPIREGSTGSELGFVHATGTAATPTPTLSVVSLSGTTLSQSDYAWKEGAAPFWVFQSTPTQTTQLLTNVNPISATKPIFSYFSSATASKDEVALSTPLSQFDAEHTIDVGVAFMAHPRSGPAAEEATPARMRGGVTFRLTAVSYNEAAPSLPCQ